MENCSDGGGCGRPEGVLLPIGSEEIVNTRLKWGLAPLNPRLCTQPPSAMIYQDFANRCGSRYHP